MKVSPRVRHGVEEEWLGGESRGESVYGWDEVEDVCWTLPPNTYLMKIDSHIILNASTIAIISADKCFLKPHGPDDI